ncbi:MULTISPECIES: hypothetical protein [unclassified Bradyrhizobium]|uniref:hypothetical protein n=1 Tax=unclassified Bradyrhizobium TaxID=2631580 RepID=UPI0029164412|nr:MULTISPECIES: hypothetical protein [unclassified Bradyrhizobium]
MNTATLVANGLFRASPAIIQVARAALLYVGYLQAVIASFDEHEAPLTAAIEGLIDNEDTRDLA